MLSVLKLKLEHYQNGIFESTYRARLLCENNDFKEQALFEHAALVELMFRLGLTQKYFEFLQENYPDDLMRFEN